MNTSAMNTSAAQSFKETKLLEQIYLKNQEINSLKKKLFKKECLASRLLSQRNSARFAIDQAKSLICKTLVSRCNLGVRESCSLTELAYSADEAIKESWGDYSKLLEEKKYLKNEISYLMKVINNYEKNNNESPSSYIPFPNPIEVPASIKKATKQIKAKYPQSNYWNDVVV